MLYVIKISEYTFAKRNYFQNRDNTAEKPPDSVVVLLYENRNIEDKYQTVLSNMINKNVLLNLDILVSKF